MDAAGIDEEALAVGMEPMEAVVALARAKAEAIDGGDTAVVAADTVVSLNGEIMGKPTDRDHARTMIRQMAGHMVQVLTCVAVKASDGAIDDRLAISTLRIDELTDAELDAYLDSGEADDKAGALSVQGLASAFTTIVDGTKSNVVGLPLAETVELLGNIGVRPNPT